MSYKLLDAAQPRLRRVNGHEFAALVEAGATFIDGKLQDRTTEPTTPTARSTPPKSSKSLIHNY